MRQPTDVFHGPAQQRTFLTNQAAVCGRPYRLDKGEKNAFRRLRLKILMVSAFNDISDEKSAPRSRQICPGRKKAVPAQPSARFRDRAIASRVRRGQRSNPETRARCDARISFRLVLGAHPAQRPSKG